MARELECPVLALSQLSRDVEKREGDKRPIMADLRDSGSIEQDADIVMFLYRPHYYDSHSERKGEADLIVAKNRSGSTNEGLPFMFQGEYQRFKEKKEVKE
jgi:replicative DNA helicase